MHEKPPPLKKNLVLFFEENWNLKVKVVSITWSFFTFILFFMRLYKSEKVHFG